MILWTDFILLHVIVRTAEGRATMTKNNPQIFPNRRTLVERNLMRKRMIAHILSAKFKKEFRTCRIPVGDQFFTVDLMTEDNQIAVKIVNPYRMPRIFNQSIFHIEILKIFVLYCNTSLMINLQNFLFLNWTSFKFNRTNSVRNL